MKKGNKFDLGEMVELIGVYREDKIRQGKPYKGIVSYYSYDESRTDYYGNKYYVYKIDGVGSYGELALNSSK